MGTLGVLAAAAMLALAGAQHGFAQVASETGVKAAFLYRFCDYVEWPPAAFASADSPLVIGILGADAMARALAQYAGEGTVRNRRVRVRSLRRGDPVAGVHVLFIARDAAPRLTDVLDEAGAAATLIVTESDGALDRGSIINFVVLEDKVRFDVSLPAAERREIKISARLLAVARRVITGAAKAS